MLTLTGTNTYSGPTTVSGGTLQLGSAAALPVGPMVANGGVVDLAGYSPTVSNLSGLAGTITSSTGSSTLVVNQTGSTAFSGTIQDSTAGTVGLSFGGGGGFCHRHERLQRWHGPFRRHARHYQRPRHRQACQRAIHWRGHLGGYGQRHYRPNDYPHRSRRDDLRRFGDKLYRHRDHYRRRRIVGDGPGPSGTCHLERLRRRQARDGWHSATGNANALGTGGLTANGGVVDLAGFARGTAQLQRCGRRGHHQRRSGYPDDQSNRHDGLRRDDAGR